MDDTPRLVSAILRADRPLTTEFREQAASVIDKLAEANGATLNVLPGQRHPTNNLQRLVNLARGLLDIEDFELSEKRDAFNRELDRELKR